MQQIGKHTSTTDLLLETEFLTWSMQSGYKGEKWGNQFSSQLSSGGLCMGGCKEIML
jgi:hypothetical protein